MGSECSLVRGRPLARSRLDSDGGFSLIELLVVVIIVGLLTAVAVPVLLAQRDRAYMTAVRSDLRNAAVEMYTFLADTGEYPSEDERTAGDVSFANSPGVTLTIIEPAALGASLDFCLTGSHAALSDGGGVPDGVVLVYDSADGGLREASGC